MRTRLWFGLALLGVSFLASSCVHVISKDLRAQVDKAITFKDVLADPDAYKGRVVIWGGSIIEAGNQKDGTLLEVLQKPMGLDGRPKEGDVTEGRFLALYPGFLDTAVYARNREVTVAGEIQGKVARPIGQVEYNYPLISAGEIHLWPERPREIYAPYWSYPWGYPYPWWWDYPNPLPRRRR